ncbi:MAG: bifunctional (p)ppGpp synthetase/guanosine-3',5'-bis(diphosphate) 3'-pyrophosphohydrolase, partial [Clostridia bacterium]|nr:bifunctional (p)ppGpp synthetase/guanosine-3',5'-bis(diphosphate) 3'-pyrophosphohydrolase [Clostridia bacterium]
MIDFNLLDYVSDERVEIFKKYINENPKNYALLKEMFDILKLYKMDTSSFYACGLFVLIDKNLVDYEKIKLEFGEDVLKMLKKLNEVGFQQSSDENIEYVRNMFMAMVQDVRVLIILLAYNLYRAKHLDEMEEDEKSRFAKTIKDIYSPLSARLGLREIKNQLENISFKYYDPDMFNQLSQDDLLNKEERLKQIEITIKKIQEILKQSNIEGQVYGREKHLASVYNKLKQKASTLSQIYDLMAVRVIVNTVEDCYIMLGKINSLFTIIPNRFKDYIAMP